MSNACRTFINSLQRSNRKFSKDLLCAKNERVLITQKGNIRCYVTIQKPIRKGSAVSVVNQFEKRGYCCNEQYVIRSPHGEIEVPDLKLHEYIWESSAPWDNKVAIECAATGRSYTFAQARKLSETIAASFQNKFGLKKGDCIAACLPNLPEYPIIFLAGSQAGLIITTLNPVYTPDEIAKQLKDANAKLIITMTDMYQTLDAATKLLQKKMPIVVLKSKQDSSVPPGAVLFNELMDKSTCGDFKYVEISNEDTSVLPYSSGTTGMPKGVELTHRNLVANIKQLDHPGPRLLHHTTKDEQDTVLGILPMFHIYGMVVTNYTALVAGAKIVSMPKFDPQLFIETLVKHRINIAYLVPPLVLFLGNHPAVKPEHLATIRVILSGAAPLGFTDVEKVHAKAKNIRIGQGYGMTETSPTILSSHKDRYHKYASTGVPMPSTEVKIADVDTGDSLPVGKVGELRVKGPQVMKGYLNRPDANKEIFDHHGWLRTGDMGYYDEDGDFFIVDRMKELIKVKGFQVAPAELEEILRNHPKVLDAAVVGVRHEEKGEVPKAFVVVKPGEKASENEVKDYVKEKVTKYKYLEGGVVFLDAIPKSAAGKILRKELKAKYGS